MKRLGWLGLLVFSIVVSGCSGDEQAPDADAADAIGAQLETGTVFMNRCDYLDPALCWTGCKSTGKGGSLSEIGYHNLTRPKSYHLKKVTS